MIYDFLFLTETIPPVLPDGWEEHIDHQSGKTYYANHITKQTSWDVPKDTESDSIERICSNSTGA